MSPNMQLKALRRAALKGLKNLVAKLPKRPRKNSHKHHLGSHAESVYIWTLLGVDAETSQEMRINRNDRRTNGFSTVEMTIGVKAA